MEIEPSPGPVVAKKLWNMVRVLFFMMKKGIAKSKIMVELHLMLERGKLAGKSLLNNTLMFHHQYSSSFSTCRSHNSSFISPHEYEFSCNNSPANPFHVIKRKNRNNRFSKSSYKYDDVSTLNAVQKVLEMLNNNNNNNNEKVEVEVAATANSPLVTLPGFGKSPIGRQLRVTDSPFPLKDEGDSHQVDMAAEEFINKFYKDLKLQKRSVAAAFESPYHNLWDR